MTYAAHESRPEEQHLPELEQVARIFWRLTGHVVHYAEKEVTILRAEQDKAALAKENIKLSTMNHARMMFKTAYANATGRQFDDGFDNE